MKTNPTSMRQIPALIFAHFARLPIESLVTGTVSATGYSCAVTICTAKQEGPNGPFTLVLKERTCSSGRHHSGELQIYNYPAELEHFHPEFDGFNHNPIMSIRSTADHPPYRWNSVEEPSWINGRGFWVNEGLEVIYGGSCVDSCAQITSNHGDWEFEFLLDVQLHAHCLARQIDVRGHWQIEWNPKGNFSKKPKLKQ